jgi:hypothetical protein
MIITFEKCRNQICSRELLQIMNISTLCYIPEGHHLRSRRRENLKSHSRKLRSQDSAGNPKIFSLMTDRLGKNAQTRDLHPQLFIKASKCWVNNKTSRLISLLSIRIICLNQEVRREVHGLFGEIRVSSIDTPITSL